MEEFFVSKDWITEDPIYGENWIFRVHEIERNWFYRIGRKTEEDI